MEPFPSTLPTCPKCGGTMAPRFCHDCSVLTGAEKSPYHMHWNCCCGFLGPVTATMDAKRVRRISGRSAACAYIEVGADGALTWVGPDGSRESGTGTYPLRDLDADVAAGLRRELTEAEAMALLKPKPDPFAAFDRLAEKWARDSASYTGTPAGFAMILRDTIAEARKQ